VRGPGVSCADPVRVAASSEPALVYATSSDPTNAKRRIAGANARE
jgi:hypothetical protein